MDRDQIAQEVLAAVGGKGNVTANDICMTRLRILTEDPSLVDTDQLSAARGVLGFVKRGANGIEGNEEAFDETSSMPSPIHVHISHNPLHSAALAQSEEDGEDEPVEAAPDADADDTATVEDLVSLLDDLDPAADAAEPLEEPAAEDDAEAPEGPLRVLVINGPNINMLGIREPDIYGHDSYRAMLRVCHDAALEAGFADCTCFQSNHEGDLIDAIQDAYGTYAGIIINPGAYTHTSIAILDAAKAVGLPMIEVHISKLEDREDFRQVSYIRAACFETITGLGVEGYRKAMFDMAAHLGL